MSDFRGTVAGMVRTWGGGGCECQQREGHSKCLWFCVVHGPKCPLHRHNWLSSGILQDTERFLIPCPRHVSSRLPPSGETCKYVMTPITQTNLERFSTYWYAPFCCFCLGCCAAEFGSSRETYELPCVLLLLWHVSAKSNGHPQGELIRRTMWCWSTSSSVVLGDTL
jgi:hypothetical protein